ncbi:hypothetical protein [Planobispora rosea]|uniref:hypothetical protein n=1 Tax=Planobispora rosea TaxID=35762 RepID=UPI000839EB0B|nr:hypothetical protein [Planobispora rosea]
MPPRQRLRDAAALRKRRTQIEEDGSAVIGHIYKHGFREGTPEEQALVTARRGAQQLYPQGEILSEEILQTPEHTAAGEYLVVINLGTRDPAGAAPAAS